MNKQQKQVTTQIDNLQTAYNASDEQAKNDLLAFAKAYYTFSSQSDYDKRFSKIADIVDLKRNQKISYLIAGLMPLVTHELITWV